MRLGTIAFLIGTVIFSQLVTLPAIWSLAFLPIACYLLISRSYCITAPYRYVCLFCCALICGFLWAFLHATLILQDGIDSTVEEGTAVIEGQVVSLPENSDLKTRFEFRIDEIHTQGGISNKAAIKARLSWYKPAIAMIPGDYWRLHVRLRKPYGFSNPGGFDYQRWLFQRQINATGYVVNKEKNQLLKEMSSAPLMTRISSIDYIRHLLRDLIQQIDMADSEKSFLLALGLGDRSQISTEQWQVLVKTGTNHLLAISGLHIGLAAWVCFMVGRWAWAFSVILPTYLTCQRFAFFLSILGALVYAALAGFAIPTQRALIMLLIWVSAHFFRRKFAVSDVISLSLLAVLIIDPFAVMDPGFWLSFMAITLIAYGMTCRTHHDLPVWQGLWLKWGQTQYVVALGLLPLLILWFQQYPLVGILANIIMIPYISLLIVPLTLCGIFLLIFAFPLGEYILQFAGQALAFCWPVFNYLANTTFNLVHLASPTPLILMAGICGISIILLPKGSPGRYLGIFWLLPLLFPPKELPQQGDFWFTQLDVGQGLSSVIQTKNHTMIYDTGDKFSERFNAGEVVLIPFLKQQQISAPDLLIISHGDRDHIGGAPVILENYPDIQVLTSVVDKIKHSRVEYCNRGISWHWDGVDFEILSPDSSTDSSDNIFRGNNSSCVLKISNTWHAVLLTGDIEKQVESRLIDTIPHKLAAQVLVAPHHGSKTSSSEDFIDAVGAEIVIFPVGYRNRFGFPKQDIISRYEARQTKILNTALDGALLFRFIDQDMDVISYRQQSLRFWM